MFKERDFGVQGGRHVFLDARIEKCEHAVVLGLGERIILVAVALCTGHGQPHEHTGGRIHAVDDLFDAVLLGIHAPLPIGECVAMKTRRHPLLERGPGQQIPCELLDDELVVGLVPVKRFDHPLPIAPGMGPNRVLLEAVAVCVACQIQPMPPPAFAKMP